MSDHLFSLTITTYIQKEIHFYNLLEQDIWILSFFPPLLLRDSEHWYYTLEIQKVCTDSSLMKLKRPLSPAERGYETPLQQIAGLVTSTVVLQ